MRNLMILFPGIGYHCDKPILYYGKKIAVMNGYTDCISLSYSYDGKNLRDNAAEMEKAFNSLYEQAEKQLNGVEFNQYDEILFVSKSIGTVIAAAYARKHSIKCRMIFYTPLAQTYSYDVEEGIAFIGMKDPWHYRNKVHGVVAGDRHGNCFTGIYENRSHRVIRVDSCLIENQKADAIMNTVTSLMKSFKMRPYNEDTGYGFLRHILVRTGYHTGQIMVVLVTASPVFPSKNNFVKALRKEHPEITTIVANVNNRNTSMVLGDKQQILYGKGYIEDVLCGKTFRISSKSFYQVNPIQTEVLYNKAIEFAGLTGKERVIDAYSGIGTIGMVASDNAGEVISVELNGDAVRDAVFNAKQNKVKNIRFYKEDAGDFMVKMASHKEKADVVFMDPPRARSDKKFLDSLLRLKPKKIVYISCNPETLARDLKHLTGNGYSVRQIQPVDMFPSTGHVEAVCLLSRREK